MIDRAKKIEEEYRHYLKMFKADEELGKKMMAISFESLFNTEFMVSHSKFLNMNDMIWRSGFGIVNLMEVENVNQDKWNEYIDKNTKCKTWFEFGKLAMTEWMKRTLEELKKEAATKDKEDKEDKETSKK